MSTQKVSFTVRRPTPVSRAASSTPDSDPSAFRIPALPPHLAASEPALGSPLARSAQATPTPPPDDPAYDSSDASSAAEDELVTGFDRFGVQRPAGAKKPPANTPLVIPALRNKDWRALARKRRGGVSYVPPSAAATTGADGSVGGLGTRDTINSGPVLSGLQLKAARPRADSTSSSTAGDRDRDPDRDAPMADAAPPTEDDEALRAILAEASGEGAVPSGPALTIPAPVSETDALRQDVDELPDAATLDDYARVPVAAFGAALLRGMGWKEGTAATRKPGRGLVEPYLPPARPALLGIGAKEQEVYDDGSKKKKGAGRPERRYVPIIKQERDRPSSGTASPAGGGSRDRRERSRSPRRSAASSRRASPDRYRDRRDGERNGSSGRREEGDKDMDRRRAEDRERRRNDDKRDSGRDRQGDDDKRDRDRRRDDDRDRRRDDDRHRSSRHDSSYDRQRNR